MMSMTHLQVIIDVIIFVIIMLFLHQMNRRMARMPGCDGPSVEEFKKLIVDSQNSSDIFLRAVREGEERLNHLARQLDHREKRMVILIETAESLIQKMDLRQTNSYVESDNDDGNKYGNIKRLYSEGLSCEEVANRLGITAGEVNLVMDLEHTKGEYP